MEQKFDKRGYHKINLTFPSMYNVLDDLKILKIYTAALRMFAAAVLSHLQFRSLDPCCCDMQVEPGNSGEVDHNSAVQAAPAGSQSVVVLRCNQQKDLIGQAAEAVWVVVVQEVVRMA